MKEDPYDVGLQLIDLAGLLGKRVAEIQQPITASNRIYTVLSDDNTSCDAEPYTTEIRASVGFKWLESNDHFRAAMTLFDECIKKSTAAPWQVAKQEAGFVQTVAQWVGFCFCAPNWSPRYASAEQRRKAASTADSLLDLIRKGAQMSDKWENFQLELSLTRYRDEITITKGTRQYSGPAATQRDMLGQLADYLLAMGLEKRHVVNVVETIAPLFGFSVDHRSVQRYVRRADCRN